MRLPRFLFKEVKGVAVYKVNIELDANEIAAALASGNPAIALGGDISILREDDKIIDEPIEANYQLNNNSTPDSSTIVNSRTIEYGAENISQNINIEYSTNNIQISNSVVPQYNVFHSTNKISDIEFEHEEVEE